MGAGSAITLCSAFASDILVTNNNDVDDNCYSNILDCAGTCDGDTALDDCGICEGGNATMDCAGFCYGDNVEDNCSICNSNPADDCIQDCSGDWGGQDNIPDSGDEAFLDECGACDNDSSNDGYLDECGACDNDSSNDGYLDECGVCDGDSSNDGYLDECGVCDGDNSSCADCAGIPNGDLIEDCAGECGGSVAVDECGVCDGDNTSCNECLTDNGGCDANATCTNTDGSITCACDSGYTGDGINCADINECLTDNGGCNANATCTNNEGDIATCTCNDGYSGDGTSCVDIDECTTETDDCDDNATCTNTDGSFTCDCDSGYTGDGINCTDIDECATDNGGCDANATCTNNEGDIATYTCNNGYSGDGAIGDCEKLSLYNGLIPDDYSIHSIYPNPFNPIANIVYALPENVNVQIVIFNLSGKQVKTLVNKFQTPGYHSVFWNADNHPSGLYFLTMIAGEYINTKKLMIVK